MKTFKELIIESAGDWYIDEFQEGISKDGAGMSGVTIGYDKDEKEWFGNGRNKQGDSDARTFWESNFNNAVSAATKVFKLGSGSLVISVIVAAAKEYTETKKVTINLTKKYLEDDSNINDLRDYISKWDK